MSALFEGIQYGLVLAIMVGPIFFVLLQTALEEGFFAGMMVVFGIFVSDLFFVSAVYFSLSELSSVIENDNFKFYLGMIGGFIFVGSGLGILLKKPPEIPDGILASDTTLTRMAGDEFAEKVFHKHSYFSLWFKGFAVNTFNPFTVVFWFGLAGLSIKVVDGSFDENHFLFFVIGILSVVLITDSLKVFLAKILRKKLKPKYIVLIRRFSGLILLIFGLYFVFFASGVF